MILKTEVFISMTSMLNILVTMAVGACTHIHALNKFTIRKKPQIFCILTKHLLQYSRTPTPGATQIEV